MPFGRKSADGRSVDFDAVWDRVIRPAIEAANMMPLRADEEQAGGIIHRPMFERLLLCDYVVCDLTFANANVFYELGIRHAARPYTTVLIAADAIRLPFDVAMLRTMSYALDGAGNPAEEAKDASVLGDALIAARTQSLKSAPSQDSPLFQLLDGIEPLHVPSDKTDVFREQVEYSEQAKAKLMEARQSGKEAIDEVRRSLGAIDAIEAGVAVDIMLSYRAIRDWQSMIDLVDDMPEQLRRTVLVQEQLGFALNRAGNSIGAERVLRTLIEERGPSSETLGILGRVYKDRWEQAKNSGETTKANALLGMAIQTYKSGFETDWRDHYPGMNAVTLMEIQEPPDPARIELLPVVRYSVQRRIETGEADYWDWATLLELEVLADNQEAAHIALGEALINVRESFEPETTQRNIRLIRIARAARGDQVAWIEEVEMELGKAAA